jgi:hypothetical protein
MLLGLFAGTLEPVEAEEDGSVGVVDCDGTMWYTASREVVHALIWNSPACCELATPEVQLFVTGSMQNTDYLRQQQLLITGDVSGCRCSVLLQVCSLAV